MTKSKSADDYGIKKLSDYQHSRHRTEMYFGSRTIHSQETIIYQDGKPVVKEMSWIPSLYTYFREVVDNSLDEIAYGYGTRLDVTYDPDKMEFSVQDHGRGIPIDYDEEFGGSIATTVLTETKTGRNFGDRQEVAGTNGLGVSITNFCSEYMKVEIRRDNKVWRQNFRETDDELLFGEPEVSRVKSDQTGTKITFRPSKKVFKDMSLPEEFVAARMYEIAFCNPLIKVYYNGERIKVKPTPEKTLFERDNSIITIDIKEDTFRTKFILKPAFQESGEYIHSIVNNIPAFNGGVHIETFRNLFYKGMISALERESKRRKLTPNRSDVNDGLLIFNITNMRAPNFDSQSKTRLINEEVGKILRTQLDDEKFYKNIVSKNRDWVEQIYSRCEARTQKKDQSEVAKTQKKMLRNKVPDLVDCTSKVRTDCILLLGEGKSAVAGFINARDPKIHAGLPLRGKVMNVMGENPKDVVQNQALTSIMASIGLIIGQKADRKKLNYGAVYIAHDMDHDGLNIGALLINFFYAYWPELFDPEQKPFFNIFMTPFVIAKKGKERHYWFQRNYHEFRPEDYRGWAITRAKGLGTLQKEDWKFALQNPELYPVVDDGKLADALSLVFDKGKADSRKEWIGL